MNLLSVDDLSLANIANILYLARNAVYHECNRKNKLNKIIATAFFEPSTRTKLSFQTAILRLGGNYIDLPDNSSIKKGESQEDTIRTLSQYADCIVIRHPQDVRHFAKYSSIPVINAGDNSNEHPTQALMDLHTIVQNMTGRSELKIMFTGDTYYSRTINSLVMILSKYEYCKTEFIFTNQINHKLESFPHKLIREEDIPNYIDSVDVLYMTRSQVERWQDKGINSNFVLNNELADKMKKDAIIMHPFPRNGELLPEVDNNPRAKYFEQMKNGLYIRMSILHWLL